MAISDAEAIAEANCIRCEAKKGDPCVDLRRRFAGTDPPIKTVHQERRDAVRRNLHNPTSWFPLRVGATLRGFCGGAFGRESYGDKTIEAIGPDWVVIRTEEGEVEFYAGDPKQLKEYL